MGKSDELARLLEKAEHLIQKYMGINNDPFLGKLYSDVLHTLVETKIEAKNNDLAKGNNMFGFSYIISDFSRIIPNEIQESVFEASKYYRDVYSK